MAPIGFSCQNIPSAWAELVVTVFMGVSTLTLFHRRGGRVLTRLVTSCQCSLGLQFRNLGFKFQTLMLYTDKAGGGDGGSWGYGREERKGSMQEEEGRTAGHTSPSMVLILCFLTYNKLVAKHALTKAANLQGELQRSKRGYAVSWRELTWGLVSRLLSSC